MMAKCFKPKPVKFAYNEQKEWPVIFQFFKMCRIDSPNDTSIAVQRIILAINPVQTAHILRKSGSCCHTVSQKMADAENRALIMGRKLTFQKYQGLNFQAQRRNRLCPVEVYTRQRSITDIESNSLVDIYLLLITN